MSFLHHLYYVYLQLIFKYAHHIVLSSFATLIIKCNFTLRLKVVEYSKFKILNCFINHKFNFS